MPPRPIEAMICTWRPLRPHTPDFLVWEAGFKNYYLLATKDGYWTLHWPVKVEDPIDAESRAVVASGYIRGIRKERNQKLLKAISSAEWAMTMHLQKRMQKDMVGLRE